MEITDDQSVFFATFVITFVFILICCVIFWGSILYWHRIDKRKRAKDEQLRAERNLQIVVAGAEDHAKRNYITNNNIV